MRFKGPRRSKYGPGVYKSTNGNNYYARLVRRRKGMRSKYGIATLQEARLQVSKWLEEERLGLWPAKNV